MLLLLLLLLLLLQNGHDVALHKPHCHPLLPVTRLYPNILLLLLLLLLLWLQASCSRAPVTLSSCGFPPS
jgi:hypothetical protein